MTTRIVLLDAGNTRLKWAIVDTARRRPGEPHSGTAEASLAQPIHWLDQGAAGYDALSPLPALWSQWGTLAACYGVSVVDDAARACIEKLLAHTGLEPRWLKPSAAACGVKNGYHPAQSLGADRWAALLAVRQRTPAASLIVSAGSALTVDALNADGQFLGGIIVPGLHMMREALARSTAQVGHQYGHIRNYPNTTADAVETGLVAACTGAIETMLSRMRSLGGTPPRGFLTGGDAATLQSFLPPIFEVIPALVLEGVYHLAREGVPT